MSSPPNPASFRQSPFFKRWLTDKATYPLFIIMGCAGVLVAFAGSRQLFSHPDVYVGKGDRGSVVRENLDRGTAHTTNAIRTFAKNRNDSDKVTIFPSLNSTLLARHINPEAKKNDYEDDE